VLAEVPRIEAKPSPPDDEESAISKIIFLIDQKSV
jgi:hypothetical protein